MKPSVKASTNLIVVPTSEQVRQAVEDFESRLTLPAIPVINTPDLYIEAAETLKDIKGRIKDLETEKAKLIDPMKAAQKAAVALFAPVLERLTARETAIKSAIIGWNRHVEEQQRIAQARLDEARRKEEARLERRAEKLEAQGKVEQAEAVRDNMPPAAIAVVDAPKVTGIAERTTWSAEVTDMPAFVAYALQMDQTDTLLTPNSTTLNAYARALKAAAKMPGVRFSATTGIAAGSR